MWIIDTICDLLGLHKEELIPNDSTLIQEFEHATVWVQEFDDFRKVVIKDKINGKRFEFKFTGWGIDVMTIGDVAFPSEPISGESHDYSWKTEWSGIKIRSERDRPTLS